MRTKPLVRVTFFALAMGACDKESLTEPNPDNQKLRRTAAVAANSATDLGLGVVHLLVGTTDSAFAAQNYSKMRQAGFTWVRMELDWYNIEPTGPAEQWLGNGWVDAMLNSVKRVTEQGLQVYMTLKTSPAWAQSGSFNPLKMPAATHLDYWDRYVRKMHETFGAYVHHWGVWNEPNAPDHFVPNGYWLDDYETLLTRTSQVLWSRDPTDWLIGYDLAWGFVGQDQVLGGSISRMSALPNLRAVALHRYDLATLLMSYFEGTPTPNGDNIDSPYLYPYLGPRGRYELWLTEYGLEMPGIETQRRDHLALFLHKWSHRQNHNWTKIFYFIWADDTPPPAEGSKHAMVSNYPQALANLNADLMVPGPAYYGHKYAADTWVNFFQPLGGSVNTWVLAATQTAHPVSGYWVYGQDHWAWAGDAAYPMGAVIIDLHPAAKLAGMSICYRVHFSWIGWMPADPNAQWYCNGDVVGPISWPGSNFHGIEAIQVRVSNQFPSKDADDTSFPYWQHPYPPSTFTMMRVCYQAYLTDIGYQAVKCNGDVAGTTGQGRVMRALRVWLDGDMY